MTGRLLLFTTGDFPSKAAQTRAENWVNLYVKELSKLQISTDFFDPWNSKVLSTDIVQVFGYCQKENWYALKQRSRGIILTAWPETIFQEEFLYPSGWKLWIDHLRIKCFPQLRSFEGILGSVDFFFLNASELKIVGNRLKQRAESIHALPQDPKELAKLVNQAIHQRLG